MKNKFIILALLTLSACGFKPLYAQVTAEELAKIHINEIPTYDGQIVRNELQDLFASTGNDYTLDVKLLKERRGVGIQEDFRVSRLDIILEADYTLTSNLDKQVLVKDRSIVYSSFDRTESEFSTFVAEEDASRLAAQEVAFEIRSKIAAYFSR